MTGDPHHRQTGIKILLSIFLRATPPASAPSTSVGPARPGAPGEEIDYLVRALDEGARVEYDPSLVDP
jgi:hypothetical protein